MIEKKLSQHSDIRTASKEIKIEIIYYFSLKMQKVSNNSFIGSRIKQITIPSKNFQLIWNALFCFQNKTELFEKNFYK